MKILAIDTTAQTAAAALTEDGRPIGVYAQNGTMTHSETMLNMVENLLKNAQTEIDDVELFAVRRTDSASEFRRWRRWRKTCVR